jgi:hypothetical protein
MPPEGVDSTQGGAELGEEFEGALFGRGEGSVGGDAGRKGACVAVESGLGGHGVVAGGMAAGCAVGAGEEWGRVEVEGFDEGAGEGGLGGIVGE